MTLCSRALAASVTVATAFGGVPALCFGGEKVELDIPAQRLGATIQEINRQFENEPNVEIWFGRNTDPGGIMAPAVEGARTVEEALYIALADTDFTFRRLKAGYQIYTRPMAEVLVRGARSFNVDISRSEDDSQPYVVFDRKQIEQSTASNVGAFVRAALPGNVPGALSAGASSLLGVGNEINLHGLSSQTLVLIDGRRIATPTANGDEQQPDLEAIPMSVVERVEISPPSSSAAHGGSAIAAVVNVIMRRGERGTNVAARVEQLAGISAGVQEVSVQKTGELEKGWVTLTGTWLKRDSVWVSDWDTFSKGRALVARNNPAAVTAYSIPIAGDLWNVRTVDGSPLLPEGTSPFAYVPLDFRLGDALSKLRDTQGKYATGLAPSAQLSGGGRASLRPSLQGGSAGFSGGWDFTTNVSADFDLGYSRNVREALFSTLDESLGRFLLLPARAVFNPFDKDVYVVINSPAGDALMTRRDTSFRASTGVTMRLPAGGVLRLDERWSDAGVVIERPMIVADRQQLTTQILSHFNQALTAEQLGLQIQYESTPKYRNSLHETALRWSGDVYSLPLSLTLVRLREEVVNALVVAQDATSPPSTGSGSLASPERSKTVYSLAAALDWPILGRNGDHGALTAHFSARGDVFSITPAPSTEPAESRRFRAFSGALSMDYEASPSVILRAHCAKGFAPPPLSSLTQAHSSREHYPQLTDPARGHEPVGEFTLVTGGDPDLSPEHSLACGGGFIYRPGNEGNSRLSLDYTWLRRWNVVATPAERFFADPNGHLTDPANLLRASPDTADPYAVGKITTVYSSSQNIAEQTAEYLNFSFDWAKSLDVGGTVRFSTRAILTPRFQRKKTRYADAPNDAGWGGAFPTHFSVVAHSSYERDRWLVGLNGRFTPEYEVSRDQQTVLSQGARTVDEQLYIDLVVRYAVPVDEGAWEIRFDAQNLLRQKGPFDAAAADLTSPHGRGELASYSISLRKSF